MQQRKVIATWNSNRDLWETNQTSLFEPLAVYSETWPTCGSMRNGVAYELPTSEHHTAGTGSSSLLPTPTVGNHNESGNCRDFGGDITHALTCNCKLLPTPNTMDSLPARSGEAMERQLRRGEGPDASRRSTMGNLREDILLTVDPTIFDGEPTSPPSDVGSES